MGESLLHQPDTQPFSTTTITTLNKPKPALRLSKWLRQSRLSASPNTPQAAHSPHDDDQPPDLEDTASILSLPTTIVTRRGNTNSGFIPTTPLHYPAIKSPEPLAPVPLPVPPPPPTWIATPIATAQQQQHLSVPASAFSVTTTTASISDSDDTSSRATHEEQSPSTIAFLLRSGASVPIPIPSEARLSGLGGGGPAGGGGLEDDRREMPRLL
jgi:hypothetical protein